jgi:hypothetical protein
MKGKSIVFISLLTFFVITCSTYSLFCFFLHLCFVIHFSCLHLYCFRPYFLLIILVIQLFCFNSIFSHFLCCVGRDSSVGVVTRLRTGNPRSPVSIPNGGKSFFSFPNIPDWFWSPLSLVLSGCRERFPRGYGKRA